MNRETELLSKYHSLVNALFLMLCQMLKSMLSSWSKKGEKYRFINVNSNLKKALLSVLPTNVSISSSNGTHTAGRHTFSIGKF
jgi:sodium-independent sulfate anion transporter 11